MVKRCLGAFVALGIAFVATEASAQYVVYTRPQPVYYRYPPRNHDGLYLRLALGGGYFHDSFGLTSTQNQRDSNLLNAEQVGGTFAGEVAIGGSVVPGVIVAGTLMWESVQGDSISGSGLPAGNYDVSTLFLLGPKIDWYVNPHRGFHLEGALGVSKLQFSGNGVVVDQTPWGGGGAVGIGWEFPLGPKLGLGIMGRFLAAHMVDGSYTHDVQVGSLLGTLTYN